MKKNFLAPVLNNKTVSSVTKFCTDHKSTLLAGGTIGFSITTTAVVFRNSPMIHQIIWDTRDAVEAANSEEERKSIYKAAIKELYPLVVPIIFFQTGTIITTIMSKKDLDKKDSRIAELTSAAAVATQAIEQYQLFQKEAEEQLGEKKLTKVREAISTKEGEEIIDMEVAPGEFIFRDHYCGHIFKGTKDTVRLACERMCNEAKDNDYGMAVLNGEYYRTLGVPDDAELGDRWGYYAENDRIDVTPQFTLKEFYVNGTMIPGYEVWLTPSPEYLDE